MSAPPRITPLSVRETPVEQVSLAELVRECAEAFARAGIERPREEARDLIAAVLDRPRFWASLHPGELPPPGTVTRVRGAAARRAAGAPFAYAVGRSAFRFLTLGVDERVLIPRPETEQLVDIVLSERVTRAGGGVAIDVGTGSGAIALALAAEARFDRVLATDVSIDALRVARANAHALAASLRTPIFFGQGAGLAPVRDVRARVIVSNPPYIAFGEMPQLPRLVRDWEPASALCCASDGLAVTRDIIAGAERVLEPGGLLALETDTRRAADVARLAQSSGCFRAIEVRRDLTGRARFVLATRATPA
jgi:release factor glutamine methyltransferase